MRSRTVYKQGVSRHTSCWMVLDQSGFDMGLLRGPNVELSIRKSVKDCGRG